MFKRYLKSEQTDKQTDRHTDRRTFRLIESVDPEGRCFENHSLSLTCKFGKAGRANDIDEIKVNILILPYISNLTKLQSNYFFQMNILSWLFIPDSPNSWVHLNRP